MSKLYNDLGPIVNNILSDKKTMTKNELNIKYAAFRERFITLFDLLLNLNTESDNIETMNMLNMMLKVLEKKDTGLIGVYDADVEVSSAIADKYLYTKESGIKKPDAETLNEISKKLRVKHDIEQQSPLPEQFRQ